MRKINKIGSFIGKDTIKNSGDHRVDPIQIIVSKRIETPVLIGFLKPVILIPEIELAAEELNYIISHELIHVNHCDILFKYFFELVLSIYWWLIPMYILRDKVNQILELRVDQELTEALSDEEKIRYIETLLKIAKSSNQSNEYSTLTIGFSACENELYRRTENVIKNKYTSKWTGTTKVILLVYAFLSTFIIFETYSVDKVIEETTVKITQEKWLLATNDEQLDVCINNGYVTIFEKRNELAEINGLRVVNLENSERENQKSPMNK